MSTIYVLEPPTKGKVVLNTSHGPLDIELWPKEAPKAVRNFVQLCLEGYYNHTIFHRIIKAFLVQAGDPTGTGTGTSLLTLTLTLTLTQNFRVSYSQSRWFGFISQVAKVYTAVLLVMSFIRGWDSSTEDWLRVPMLARLILMAVSSLSPWTAVIGLTRRIPFLARYFSLLFF